MVVVQTAPLINEDNNEDKGSETAGGVAWWRQCLGSRLSFVNVKPGWLDVGLLSLASGAATGSRMTYPLFAAVRLVLGTLYPAYASYKAVRTKNVREYVRNVTGRRQHFEYFYLDSLRGEYSFFSQVKWMMYWIVFALFSAFETFADVFIAFW